MYLKQLDLIGFKSFAERTRLDFGPEITAIVGPNGCGKTNIVDGIKWALGEQSAKSLRGSRMEDVIFHGTDDRKGIGMAEVSVTFDNSKKLLPLEFSEVTVTRRVFRSGEGQYFINKNLCRLKDIDDILMDTGIGMRAYSVFEQGRMDLILSSRPEERRFVFEEAAGITKYKERKRETLHKLEITETNLVRLNDIIKEVQRQLNSIERAAAKARRYKKTSDELRSLEVKLLGLQLKDLQKKLLESEKDKLFTEQEVSGLRETINEKEAKISELRKSLRQIDAEISSVQDERLLVETTLVSNKQQIQYNLNKIQELRARDGAIDSELEKLDKDLTSLRHVMDELVKEISEAHNIRNSYKNRLDGKNNEVKSLAAKCEELSKELSAKKDLLVGKTAKESHIKNELSGVDLELKGLNLKERRDSVEIGKKRKQKEQLSMELMKMEGVIAVQKEALLDLRQKIKDNEEKVILLKDEVADIGKALRDKQQYFAEKRSEYEIFSSQKKELEGYGDGVKVILENKDEFPGVIGTVSEIINVPRKYSSAISSALGAKAQWVVVDTLLNACRAAEKLHDKNVSQTVFLALELLPDEEVAQDKNFGVRAADVVDYDKRYEKLVRFLLGKTLITNDLRPVLRCASGSGGQGLIEKVQSPWILVTKDGIVFNPIGIVSGGGYKGNLTNLISRDASINELKDILNNISNEILALTEKHKQGETRLLQEERQLESAKNNLYNEEIAFSLQENDFLRHKTAYESLCEEIEVLDLDEKERDAQKEHLTAARLKKDTEFRLISDELKSIYSEIEKGESASRELDNKRQKEEREYTELKIVLVGAEEKENLLEFKRVEMQKQIDASLSAINKLSGERRENGQIAERLKEEISRLELDVGGLFNESTGLTNRQDVVRVKRQEIEKGLTEIEETLRKERQACDEVYSQLNDRQLRLGEMRLKIDNIMQRLQNEYKVAPDTIDNTLPEGLSIDWLEQEIAALRDKLAGMGEVSLVAIEEQDSLVKRHEFLNSQRQDLVNAKDSLLKAIAKLNTTTKKLFWDTFCEIRENFNKIFCQLFGGGKADLVLVDESDILESGIEIIARPPGKRLQNVSLLSGGEKALTAIALLFGIFKTKPSPFCIMDEIDAPLDDSNIDRFVDLLREFAKTSQFLIVTHNKRTISAANALYGITMQESGVSKVVSVRFAASGVAAK